MKVILQETINDEIRVYKHGNNIMLKQHKDLLCLDKTGAKQLFKVLQEFVDEESS